MKTVNVVLMVGLIFHAAFTVSAIAKPKKGTSSNGNANAAAPSANGNANTADSSVSDSPANPPAIEFEGHPHGTYTMVATATVNGQTVTLRRRGVTRRAWSDFAWWCNDNRELYFIDGTSVSGPLHANTQLLFDGRCTFDGAVSSSAASYGGTTNQCQFSGPPRFSVAAAETLTDIDLAALAENAALMLSGPTTIELDGRQQRVTNADRGWDRQAVTISAEALIYVDGDVTISGTLDGRLSIVSGMDIVITNHLTYVSDPRDDPACDDMLGLIAGRDLVVSPSCPDDLVICAHMIASGVAGDSRTDGSFGVADHGSGDPRGTLTIVGGVIQNVRGALGTLSSASGRLASGYHLTCAYDARFAQTIPPHYPALRNRLARGTWYAE